MKTEQYTVVTAGFIAGKHREVGDTFHSTERAMRYPLLSGQVKTEAHKSTATKPAKSKTATTTQGKDAK